MKEPNLLSPEYVISELEKRSVPRLDIIEALRRAYGNEEALKYSEINKLLEEEDEKQY